MTQPDLPADPPLLRTHVGAGVAAWSEDGEGPCVLMVHGMPGSGRDFRWLAPGLLPDHQVVRVDLPGFGGTPARTAGYGVRQLAAHVERMLEVLDLREVTLVGHSFGCPVSLVVAANRPDRVARVALICPIGLRPHRGFRQITPKPAWLSRALNVPLARPSLARLIHRNATKSGFSKAVPPAEFVHTMHHLATFDFAVINEVVRRVTQPTLVAWCEDDPLIEPEIVEELVAQLPEGPRLRFPDGQHNPQKVHGVEIAAAIRDWL